MYFDMLLEKWLDCVSPCQSMVHIFMDSSSGILSVFRNGFHRNAIVIFVFPDLVLIILKGHKVTEPDISKTEKQVNMYDMHIGNFLRHPILT